jgi:hypothetical protein
MNSTPRSTVTGFCASRETQPVKINVINWIEGTNPLERNQPLIFSSSPAKLLRARQQCDERVLLTFLDTRGRRVCDLCTAER